MPEPTMAEAMASEAIVLAEYVGCHEPEKAMYFGGVDADYRTIAVMQGRPVGEDLRLRYSFHDGSACIEPPNWRFDEKTTMPAAGSRWILFLRRADPKVDPWATYRGGWGCWEATPAKLRELFAAVPESANLGGGEVALGVNLWRDFMPAPPTEGKALLVTFRLEPAPGARMPEGSAVDRGWVVCGDEVWERELPAGESGKGEAERTVRDGPKWEPGSQAEAVVRVRDRDGRAWLLRRSGLTIQRTD